MTLLRWIGAVVVIIWLLGVVFRFAGVMIHWLLLIAVVIFIIDLFTGKKIKE
ncbi:lmo0937 family membrane protein [Clostridium akagii]|uniref:lmo0937 family membrane protein n=1 Tax=Clostridium akagii TaxID=91623 RepID=UPI000B1DD7A7|nr:lmo0937 family membrane protein [Clostridium akagii]